MIYPVANISRLKSRGWYIEPHQLEWVNTGEVSILEVPVDVCFQWEYDKEGGLTKNDVQFFLNAWKQGRKFPCIEGTWYNNKIKIVDGQHRWVAWKQLHQTIPVLVTTD